MAKIVVGDTVYYENKEWTVEEFWSAHGIDLVTIRDDEGWAEDIPLSIFSEYTDWR